MCGMASEVPAEPESVAPDAVRLQLERILMSPDFVAADRGRKFLRFLVEEALAGHANRLKEYTLAVEVFDRNASFDPTTNPAVRVEASRLRRKLEHYYLTLGREDPVLIELPRGTYAPVFRSHADVLHLRDDMSALETTALPALLPIDSPGGPSIAVLPFVGLGDESERLFADGITVEIISALSRFRDFHLIGRSTTFQHREKQDAVTLGRLLGVRYLLWGDVRRAEHRLRVSAELSSGTDGQVLWAEVYEQDLSVRSVFDIQDDIANHVVATIAQPHGVIVRPEIARAKRKPLKHMDAYECVLLYYDYAAQQSPERHARALAALDRAVAVEPDSAAVLAACSMVYTDMARFGFNVQGTREEALVTGLRFAQTAVKLDPLNPVAYHALFLCQYARGDLKAFREAGKRAVELNPNNTDILADYGLHLILSDDLEPGRLLMKVALALNPEPPDWYWFAFYSLHGARGEDEDALDMALRATNEDFFWTHGMQASAYARLGMKDEARAAVQRLLVIYPDFATKARSELERLVGPGRIERALDALREAGLAVA